MTTGYYLYCGALGLMGILIALLLQLRAQQTKALKGNLQFSVSGYFSTEWLSIALSFAVLALALMLIPLVQGYNPNWVPYIRPFFVPIGYMGQDILLKVMGKVNVNLNDALGYKAGIADASTGQVVPTPAAPPQTS